MLTITSPKGKQYQLKSTYHDLIISDLQRVKDIEVSKRMELFWHSAKFDHKLHEAMIASWKEDDVKEQYRFIRVLFEWLIGEEISTASDEELFQMYMDSGWALLVVEIRTMAFDSHKPDLITSFKYKGKTYKMPKAEIILNDELKLAELTSVQFVEILDMSMVNNMAGLTAAMCMPTGVKYSEAELIERAGEFEGLPAEVFLDVFFCLLQLGIRYKSITATYLAQKADQAAGWRMSGVASPRADTIPI